MATELYQRTITYDYGDEDRRALMEEVWSGTPWMLNVFTGSCNEDRDLEIRDWCHEHLGDEAWPIHGRPGAWQRGGATIYGWTWYGFAKEEDMLRFQEAFPSPEEEKYDE